MASSWPELGSTDSEKRRELKISGKVLTTRLESDNVIPTELFVKLPALNFLELSEAPQLTSLPNNLGRLSALTNLILQGNRLEKLPDSLGDLKKLKFLDVSRNSLSEIPASIGGCVELQTLSVAHNQLQNFPESLANCVHLAHVDASYNQFESFPTSIVSQKLQHLADIILKSNRIGDIPSNISDLAALKSLDLSENKILIVPGELGDCPKLKDLHLRGNELTDRRLRKLTEDGSQKAILDYVRKNCAKTSVEKKQAKSKMKPAGKAAKKASLSEDDHDGEAEKAEGGLEHPKHKIVVTPARPEVKIIWHKDVAEIRPHVLFCILKNVTFSDGKTLKEFLALQVRQYRILSAELV